MDLELVSDGSHPLWDREELMDVYRGWRQVLDTDDPPRAAVAEASVHPTRRWRYSDPSSLGQAFTFDLYEAHWDAAQLRRGIELRLEQLAIGASCTWTLANHDCVRAASRFGLPLDAQLRSHAAAKAWVTRDGASPVLDAALGLARARARAGLLLELALPGSTYLYRVRSWVCTRWPTCRKGCCRTRSRSAPVAPVALPAGELLPTSGPLDGAGLLPASTTAWVLAP